MALSGQSISLATDPVIGAALMFDEPRLALAQVTITDVGSVPNSWNIVLEGTLDGVNWANLRNFSNTSTGSYLLTSGDLPVMGIRANLKGTSDGSSVSVFLSAAEF